MHFRGGMFRWVSNWNILAPVTAGVFEVSPTDDGVRVRYRVTFGQMLAFFTLGVPALFGPAVLRTPGMSFANGVGILAFFWCVLFGGNFLITWLRFPGFVARSLSRPGPDRAAAPAAPSRSARRA